MISQVSGNLNKNKIKTLKIVLILFLFKFQINDQVFNLVWPYQF